MNKVASRMGILTYQANMDVIANNIANVNTNGFKPFRASLADLIYTERDYQNDDTQYGHGVRVQKSDFMFKQGARVDTGRSLDYFAADESFFAVEDINGDVLYTKYGAFQITQTAAAQYDADGVMTAAAVWQLTDANNGFVLDENNEHITVPFITGNDDVPTTDIDYESLKGMIALYNFANPHGIRSMGDNYYAATDSSGEAALAEEPQLMSGALETSDVEMARQMTDMMVTQRAFSLNINMYKTYTEMTNLVNNLKN
jgi:flagellar basal-body rod protein FlgG